MSDMDGLLRESCRWNTAAWMENFGKIADDSGDIVTPTCNEFQREVSSIIEWCHDNKRPCRIIILKPRRKGSSTVSVAAGYRRLQAKRATGCIAGGSHYQGGKLLDMMKIYADNDGLDPKTCKVMDMEGRFKNGSTMDRMTLANASAGRAGGYQFLVITEMAFLGLEGVANAPAVVSGLLKTVKFLPDTIVILESTANGAVGDYYERWQGGVTFEEFQSGRNGFIKVFYPWFAFEDSRLKNPESEGLFTKADLTEKEEELAEKYGLDLEQIAWMRMTLRDECRGDFDKFCEDYPFSAESAFRATGSGRFSSTGIEYQKEVARMAVPRFGVLEYNERADRVTFRPTEEREARVVMFEGPRDRCRYVAPCDPATGDSQTSGTDPDSNAYGVMRDGFVDAQGRWVPPKLVMRNICFWDGPRFGNWFDTHIVEEELWKMARYYGRCPMVVETNKDRGLIELLKLRPDANIYQREMFNRREQVMMSAYGWETTERTREMIVSGLAQALREAGSRETRGEFGAGIEIPCPWAVEELGNFVTKPSGRSEAAKGKHDDSVLMLAMGRQCLGHATPFFEDVRPAWIPGDLRRGMVSGGGGSKQYS